MGTAGVGEVRDDSGTSLRIGNGDGRVNWRFGEFGRVATRLL